MREGCACTKNKNIVEILAKIDEFTTLVDLVGKAGLVTALEGNGPFTVFAPTNAAFVALGPATIAELVKPENVGILQKILKHHVIPKKIDNNDFTPQLKPETTLAGDTAVLYKKDHEHENQYNNHYFVDQIEIIKKFRASNGIIYIIDAVLLPK